MFNPTESKDTISDWIVNVVKQAGANACPPFVIGVGIGGDFEQCCLLSKKALLREIGMANDEKFYADFEAGLLEKINALGLGPQGLGGDTPRPCGTNRNRPMPHSLSAGSGEHRVPLPPPQIRNNLRYMLHLLPRCKDENTKHQTTQRITQKPQRGHLHQQPRYPANQAYEY